MRYRLPLAILFSLTLALSGRLFRRYVVAGESMLPAYKVGDRLIAESLSYRLRPPRIGEAVIVVQPGSGGRKDLKRIAGSPGAMVRVMGDEQSLGMDEWFVLGDNLDASTDSRSLGPVQRRDILGRIWFRY